MIALLLAACTDGTDDKGPEDFDGTFVLTDDRNYRYTSSLDIGCQTVPLAEDFGIDWSALTVDLMGHAVDPVADITTISLIAFYPSQEEMAVKLANEDIEGDDLYAFADYDNTTGTTSCVLSEFIVPPATELMPEEHFTSADYTWLMTAGAGLTDNRMITFLCPEEGGTGSVTFTNDSTTLHFDAELEALDAYDIATPEGARADWSALTTHADGGEIDLEEIDLLMLARYDLSVTEIEDRFIDVEAIAAETYTLDVYGVTEADLADATASDGTAFGGFAAGELWLLALRCSTCTNPAPPFLTVIDVVE